MYRRERSGFYGQCRNLTFATAFPRFALALNARIYRTRIVLVVSLVFEITSEEDVGLSKASWKLAWIRRIVAPKSPGPNYARKR
jgi:hypothetical protein